MRIFSPGLGKLAICLSLSTFSTATASTADPAIKNANHIFNVIHDSMRQWGSSLHHNGVSFFLATVPVGTQLYHGTSNPGMVTGMEWLAFEPEHAMVFARPHRGPPPGDHPPGPPGEDDDGDSEERTGHHEELRRRHDRGPLPPPPPHQDSDESDDSGYLHTYAAAKDLRLIYLDGMSAGKTNKGTLDSQDYVLFNGSIGQSAPDKKPRRGPGGESERAEKACEMAKNEWEGRIDGVLRMEAGFEIILCSFERDLEPIRTTQVKKETNEWRKNKAGLKPHGPPGSGKNKGPGGHGPDSSRWMRAVTARYDGIGGNRVLLDYDHFVTAYAHDLDLFSDDSILPRLSHLSTTELASIRNELTALIVSHDFKGSSWNWQATADMIVTRYSDELSYLASDRISDIKTLRDHVEMLMSPFIDYNERDTSEEAERCATQLLPRAQKEQGLAARAVHHVAQSVCLALLEAGNEEKLDFAQGKLRSLMDDLDWTTWKQCRGCEDNEICVVPIWPMGTVADYDHPNCKDASKPYEGDDGESYWGGMHG